MQRTITINGKSYTGRALRKMWERGNELNGGDREVAFKGSGEYRMVVWETCVLTLRAANGAATDDPRDAAAVDVMMQGRHTRRVEVR